MKKYIILFSNILFVLSSCSILPVTTDNIQSSEIGTVNTGNSSSGNNNPLLINSTGLTATIIERTCVRTYDLAEGIDGTLNGKYRSFEFVFRGICPPKPSRKIDNHFDAELFKTKNGHKASLIHFLTKEAFGMEGGEYPKEEYKDFWAKNGEKISIIGGATLLSDMDSGRESELDTTSIRIEYGKIFVVDIHNIPPKELKQEYDDLLWTMKYGFKEVVYNPNQSSNEKTLPIDIRAIDTKRIKFLTDSIMISDKNGGIMIIGVKDMQGKMLCDNGGNDDFDVSCEVVSVKDGIIYWKSKLSGSSYDGIDITTDTIQETSYETNVSTEITRKSKEKISTTCTSMTTQQIVPCK